MDKIFREVFLSELDFTKKGECWKFALLAAKGLQDAGLESGIRIVEGWVKFGTWERYTHVWIEYFGQVVFDPSLFQFTGKGWGLHTTERLREEVAGPRHRTYWTCAEYLEVCKRDLPKVMEQAGFAQESIAA